MMKKILSLHIQDIPDNLLYNKISVYIVIYEAFCLDVAQGKTNGASNETQTHSCKFLSLSLSLSIYIYIYIYYNE